MWRMILIVLGLVTLVEAEPPTPPRPVGLPSGNTLEIEGPEDAVRVTFDDLNLRKVLGVDVLPLDVESKLPEAIQNLNGVRIRITGDMFPPNMEDGLTAFLFVKYLSLTHFGRRHDVDEKIGVKMREGTTTRYIRGGQFDVIGQLNIQSRIREGELFLLYMIEDAVVLEQSHHISRHFFATSLESHSFSEIEKDADMAVIAKWVSYDPTHVTSSPAELATYEIIHVLKDKSGTIRSGEKITRERRPHLHSEQLVYLQTEAASTPKWSHPIDLKASTAEYLIHLPTGNSQERLLDLMSHLSSSNPAVFRDVAIELLRTPHAELTAIKDQMPRDLLRTWRDFPANQDRRIQLSARLLGYCGSAEDANWYKERILHCPAVYERFLRDYMTGYLLLSGNDGLDWVIDEDLLSASQTFTRRFAVAESLRFAWDFDEHCSRDRLRQMTTKFVDDPELSDLAIGQLAKWEDWSIAHRLPELYDLLEGIESRESDRQAIIRYFLLAEKSQPESAPEPVLPHVEVARQFLDQARQKDPERVRIVESWLAQPREAPDEWNPQN